MTQLPTKNEELQQENQLLLTELEQAYKNMATILEQSEREKEIAYRELEKKFNALEELYSKLSKKENMLIHLEKLSSIGQFITEIIHELKNPLTVISGVTELTLLNPDLNDNLRLKISKIPIQIKRMSNYLNRFKAMAYKGKEDFQIFNLKNNLNDFLETIEIIRPKDINIVSDFGNEDLYVEGDPYQMTQIFLNLAKNAFDAMQDCGSYFMVRSRIMEKDSENWQKSDFVSCQTAKDWDIITDGKNEMAVIEFSDDGSGIPADLITNIFDAFFTTKGRGKGTGLGLSIATDITKRHNSNLSVKSELGQGTTFQFVIPLVPADKKQEILITENKELFF